MSSLPTIFDDLLVRLYQGRGLSQVGSEPVYYLVFPPQQIVEAKRLLPHFVKKLSDQGWTVHCFSIAEQIAALLEQSPLRPFWLDYDHNKPLDWGKANQSLANALLPHPADPFDLAPPEEDEDPLAHLPGRLEAFIAAAAQQPHSVVLVTDLEALHPYFRIGIVEGRLAGKFLAPTIIFYPGERTGATSLKFLGFYDEDGSYRSVHVGD
jgi:hypothetical protein